MTEAEKAYQYFVIAVPESEEQVKAYFWARKALQSTLTQPNETPPCYQPDGDGCAYQCYDGDDEPIDKCKECPLCYSDKQRHHAPPNEPLTCDGCMYNHNRNGYCDYCIRRSHVSDYYRRPPEGEEEAI